MRPYAYGSRARKAPASRCEHQAGMSARPALSVVPISDLRSWRDSVESMKPTGSPCPGLHGEGWQKTHAAMLAFLDRFGAEAQDLGWTDLDLFRVHPQIGIYRPDFCGALVQSQIEARAISADTVSFGQTTFYRSTPGRSRGVPIWAFKS